MYAVDDKHAVMGSAPFKRLVEVLKYLFCLVESDASFTVQLLLGAVVLEVQYARQGGCVLSVTHPFLVNKALIASA